MRIELSYEGVARNRVYFATPVTAGRPRKTERIVKTRKVYGEGTTRDEAIQNLLKAVDFKPANCLS